MSIRLLAAAAFAAVALAAVDRAHAVAVSFGGSGVDAVDPLGHVYRTNLCCADSWGIPGLGGGVVSFNTGNLTSGDGSPNALKFTFTILSGADGIAAVDSNSFVGTRMGVGPFDPSDFWSGVIGNGGKTVTFTAGPGQELTPGRLFFVNVVFTGPFDRDAFRWEAAWGEPTTGEVSEPATLALLSAGMLGFAAMRRRKAA
jgi:hypothetical protein